MILVKYGGHAIPKPGSHDPIIAILANYFKTHGDLVLVHGGGPQIQAELDLNNIQSEMISGYRKTTVEVFEIVQKVLSGSVLRTLVNQFIGEGVKAIGLSASDANLIRAKALELLVAGEVVDIGLVGEAAAVDPTILFELIAGGYFPIISPIAADENGVGYNLNADIAAGAIAGALKVEEIIFMTDVPGIYRNFPDANSLISEITVFELRSISDSFVAGMIPKVTAAISALESGAKKVRIIDGRSVEVLTKALDGVGGTVVTP